VYETVQSVARCRWRHRADRRPQSGTCPRPAVWV